MQQSSDVAETITHANGDAEDPRPAQSLRRHFDHVRVSNGRFAPAVALDARSYCEPLLTLGSG
jgi:hypothetical protein